MSGKENTVADALSCISTVTPLSSTIDLDALATAQRSDEELNQFCSDLSSSPFDVQDNPVPTSTNTITCYISTGKPRPFVPKAFRCSIFQSLHNLSHPGIKATQRLITDRYVWPNINGPEHVYTANAVKSNIIPLQPFPPSRSPPPISPTFTSTS